jgi:ABC-type lipoprotein release transport system permease subunit
MLIMQKKPRQIRLLSGSLNGVLLAQQTASNLHANPGDTVTIARLGQTAIDVKVDGVVEVSSADQFFQTIASTPQTARNALPDNIIFLPAPQWEAGFALGLAERRRSFAILQAIGATSRQLRAFLWSEALIVYVVGTASGLAGCWLGC